MYHVIGLKLCASVDWGVSFVFVNDWKIYYSYTNLYTREENAREYVYIHCLFNPVEMSPIAVKRISLADKVGETYNMNF